MIERPKIKDPLILVYVEDLEKQLEVFARSPYLATYLTIKSQIDSFNEQLTIKAPETKTIFVEGKEESFEVIPGKIDLFADKDSKEFDRAWKYLNEAPSLIKNLDELRKSLTPEETKKAEKILKDKNLPLAEQIALKNNDK